MRIKILSSPAAKYPFTETLSYSRVHKSFLPGITLLSIETSCYDFDSDKYPADIWIQKENVGEYLLGNDGPAEVKQEQNNFRFTIPVSMIEQIKPYVKIATEHNEKFLSSD